MLLLSLIITNIILACTSVVLLFILLAKWYNKQRYKAQRSNLSNKFLEILQKLKINDFKKTSLDGYFKLTTDISLKLVSKQGWKIMVSTTLTKTGVGGDGMLYFIVVYISCFLNSGFLVSTWPLYSGKSLWTWYELAFEARLTCRLYL